MAVSWYDVEHARQLAVRFRALASDVETAWTDNPEIPKLWIGEARDDHEADLRKVDRRVRSAASRFRGAAAQLESYAGTLERQWRFEEQQRQDPFGTPWNTGGV